MVRAIAMVSCALLALFPSVTWAAEPLVLEPTSDWILDYGPERCTLQRNFNGSGSDLLMQIVSNGDPYRLRVLMKGTAIPKTRTVWNELSVRLTPDTEVRNGIVGFFVTHQAETSVSFPLDFGPVIDAPGETRVTHAEANLRRRQILPQRPAFERAMSNMVVQPPGGRAIDVQTGRMTGALSALRTCVRDLRASWGIDPAEDASLSREAVVKSGTVLEMRRRYPQEMIGKGMVASVPFRIFVGPDGKAGQCVVQAEIPEAFRRTVCQGLDNDFEPALDASGKPVASIYVNTVEFGGR